MGSNRSTPVLEEDVHPTGDPNIFKVDSGSDGDRQYIVDLSGDIHTCTCTRYAITRNRNGGSGFEGECKHLTFVQRWCGSNPNHPQNVQKREAEAAATEFERLQIAEGIKNVLRDLEGL